MSEDVRADQLALIKIEGMHCHKCQQAIQLALSKVQGVHEVEVDFPSHQASVLFNPSQASIENLMNAVRDVGYKATGFMRNHVGTKQSLA